MYYNNAISLIAKEDLDNNSICVKDGECVRNTASLDELKSETFVWVFQPQLFTPNEVDNYNPRIKIHEGDMVRCFKLKI